MKKVISIGSILLILVAFSWGVFAANQKFQEKEELAVKQACLDYVEGWYESSKERLENGVHPQLVKRCINGENVQEMDRDKLVAYAVGSQKVKPEIKVEVYDIQGRIAIAKVTSDYVDYCQMAKINGKWQVLNVLWK